VDWVPPNLLIFIIFNFKNSAIGHLWKLVSGATHEQRLWRP
jgi:hypothetical protein